MKKGLLLICSLALLLIGNAQGDSTGVFVYGCTDDNALNYNSEATVDDGSYLYDFGDSTFVYGCTDSLALNYNPLADIDDGSCEYEFGDSTLVYGCTDSLALNYNPLADIDDGSCEYDFGDSTFVYGCTDSLALNYNPLADFDDGSCVYDWGDSTWVYGCTDSLALNYSPLAEIDDGSCEYDDNSIFELGQEVTFTIYPQPTAGIINVRFAGVVSEALVVRLYDLSGRVVMEKQWTVTTDDVKLLDATHLRQGVYILQVSGTHINLSQQLLKE